MSGRLKRKLETAVRFAVSATLMSASAGAQTSARPVDETVWVFPDDYPADAVSEAQGGPASVIVTVSPAGAITSCRIGVTTGSQTLDELACTVFTARGPMVPARDASGRAVPSTYIGKVHWGFWREDYQPNATFDFQRVSLSVDANGLPTECRLARDNSGIMLPMENCNALIAILPRAVALSKITGPMSLTATKITQSRAGDDDDMRVDGDIVLSETRSAYSISLDGQVSDCRTTTIGSLIDAALQPVRPCEARRPIAGASGTASHKETQIWRIAAAPVSRMPMRHYENDVSLVSSPGEAAPKCDGKVEQEEETLERLCGYVGSFVDRARVANSFTGSMKGRLRSSVRYGANPPPATEVDEGEVVQSRWVRRYRVDPKGNVTDCTDTGNGSLRDSGTRPCDRTSYYDRSGPTDPGGDLWVVEDMIYSYRLLPDTPAGT